MSRAVGGALGFSAERHRLQAWGCGKVGCHVQLVEWLSWSDCIMACKLDQREPVTDGACVWVAAGDCTMILATQVSSERIGMEDALVYAGVTMVCWILAGAYLVSTQQGTWPSLAGLQHACAMWQAATTPARAPNAAAADAH